MTRAWWRFRTSSRLRNCRMKRAVLRYRASLGVEPGVFLFGVFGYLRESKRVASVLEAFAEVHAQVPRAGLLIAGQFVSTDLERAVAPMLRAPGVYRLPYLSEREFWLAARAVDACINLRYPAAGESSGIAVRMMGIGKPVLLTDGAGVRSVSRGCVRAHRGGSVGTRLLAPPYGSANIDGRGGPNNRPTGGRAHRGPSSGGANR